MNLLAGRASSRCLCLLQHPALVDEHLQDIASIFVGLPVLFNRTALSRSWPNTDVRRDTVILRLNKMRGRWKRDGSREGRRSRERGEEKGGVEIVQVEKGCGEERWVEIVRESAKGAESEDQPQQKTCDHWWLSPPVCNYPKGRLRPILCSAVLPPPWP